MASVRNKPCAWELAYCGDGGADQQCSFLAALDPSMALLLEEMAVTYLWNWTKQAYGTCPITIRPCRRQCSSGWSTYRGRGGPNNYLPWTEGAGAGPLNPALLNGQWYNLGCGGCDNDPCSCSYVAEIDLLGPVDSVSEVLIDGVALDPTDYRIDNYRYLVRTDGSDWPVCQNMSKDPEVDPNTFQVTYNIGVEVPAGGKVAAGILACELAKMACGDKGCKLPQRVQSVTRQGVQMTLLDSFDMMYQKGTTGLTLVDMWVASVNAPIAKSGYRVASPDRRSVRRTTG